MNTDDNEPETARTDNVPAVQPPHDSQLHTANNKARHQLLRKASHLFLVLHHRIMSENDFMRVSSGSAGVRSEGVVPHLDDHFDIIVVHAFFAQYVDDYLCAEIKGWTQTPTVGE